MSRRDRVILTCITAAFLMLTGQLLAGVEQWTRRGPAGGSVQAVISDPETAAILYIAVYGAGVYKSDDGSCDSVLNANRGAVHAWETFTLGVHQD